MKYAALLLSATLVGCASTPPDIITVVEPIVSYIPYPACPKPNEVVLQDLPLGKINEHSSDEEVATAYVESVAILKSDIAALQQALAVYEKAHIEAQAAEKQIKDSEGKAVE